MVGNVANECHTFASYCYDWLNIGWRRGDFSIHISNRIRELGGGINAIKSAAIGTGMSLFEAAVVTPLGMITAYQIPIPKSNHLSR